jgi:hypothetical protein
VIVNRLDRLGENGLRCKIFRISAGSWGWERSVSLPPTLHERNASLRLKTMKTTLDIDDDVLQAAMELAPREQKTADALISEWARRGIRAPLESTTERLLVNGFEVLPAGGRVVTSELVRQIIEETHDA